MIFKIKNLINGLLSHCVFSEMKYKIAVFEGDGVGPSLVNEGIKLIEKSAELDKFEVEFQKFSHNAEHYLETKELLDEKSLKEIKAGCNAVYCGTFGDPRVETGILEKGIPGAIRAFFDQFVCLRHIRLLPGVESHIAGKTHNEINFTVLRENSEDFSVGLSYKPNGKPKSTLDAAKGNYKVRLSAEKNNELAYQVGVLSKKGCERFARFAFEYAKKKNKNKVTFVDKANVLDYYHYLREIASKIGNGYKDIEHNFEVIDSTMMHLIRQPERYQIIAAPGMIGDILSDLGTVLQGGIGFGARANINPDGISMFEPIHGSAVKLKDQNIVNPIATILAASMMLDTIGQEKSASLILKSIEYVLKEGRTRTADLDGNNSTQEMGESIKDKMVELHD